MENAEFKCITIVKHYITQHKKKQHFILQGKAK